MTATLKTMNGFVQEEAYIYAKDHLWTYITAELAMCHLLRNELEEFYRLFNGYVAHASPTNAWVEGIMLKDRRGTGDMPHGWAAAEYIFLHRNSLVYENDDVLELCWGVQPDWLVEGASLSVKNAPTRFGSVDMEIRRNGNRVCVTYGVAGGEFPSPTHVVLHIPELHGAITSILVNSNIRILLPGQKSIQID